MIEDKRLIQRLRASGLVPRFVAPVGEGFEPPQLVPEPPPVRRQIGRRIANDKREGSRG
jgi:hypothetical protein